MSKYLIPALGVLALAACGQQAQQQAQAPSPANVETPITTPVQASMTNAEFIQAALNADAFKIQASELAAQRAQRADVKELAVAVVAANRETTAELTTLAPTIQVTPQAAAAPENFADDLADLRTKNGAAFDDAYLDDQVEAHNEAIQLYERFISGGQAGPLKDWAQGQLADLRSQRDRVQALENAT